MADIFDEVNEDLRAEKAKQLAMRYGGVAAAALVLLLVGVGGWQAWRWRQGEQTAAVASSFLGAMRATATAPGVEVPATPARTAAAEEFARLANTAPGGYRTLARFRAAALRVTSGDLPDALTLWDQLAADTDADPLLRDLANLLWVQHQVDAGDPAAVEGRLLPLVAAGNPWRPMALESQAWLQIRTGQQDKARETLRTVLADVSAPDGVKGRANGLLSRLGETTPAPAPGAGG